jgi:hypothetical protein
MACDGLGVSMVRIEFSAKILRFLIEAVDFRMAAWQAQMALGTLDEDAMSDISNDTALLRALNLDLKRREAEWNKAAPPPGDARARLRLIMQCLLAEGFSEIEQVKLIDMGRTASPDHVWTDYLYWPERFRLDGSVDAALDKAMSYRPIVLAREPGA